MTNLSINAQNGKATTEKTTFSRTTIITQIIDADPLVIWNVLTNSADYPKWNSTIVSIEGKIQQGEKIKLKSILDPKRTFKLKIKEMITNQKMVWGDAMGKRTYTLKELDSGTLFTMTEKIGGFMFPLFASKIPPFDDVFEQFAQDLKKEVEKNANSK
ncbi:SRPBCC domain-containing protein [Aquimarina sp. 2201CG1-2-11]|uniref:SRPBCC domain-containing protein n=1 Tax=Aquimarina discodermiae TaxID=3231043 RepID=UPI0034634E72